MHLLTLKNILVAARPDDLGSAAVVAAGELAQAAGATLHAVSVTEAAEDQEAASSAARGSFRSMLDRPGARLDPENTYVVSGDPARAIGLLADRISADVIVMGRHAPLSSRSRGVGGTALAVVTNASCPCLVVATRLTLPLRQVLVPVDLSDTARGALLVGLSWSSALRQPTLEGAPSNGAELRVLHVQPAASTSTTANAIDSELKFIREQAGKWASVSVESETAIDRDVKRGITSYVTQHKPDLVVMGTRGLGLDPIGRLGSVAASVAERVEVPLLLVPPSVWMAHAASS